jgi:glycosyltransferase involved in cell wall biosynthesis
VTGLKKAISDTRVTVVIPTYKGAGCLPDAMKSVFDQSQPPAEIIVVDDRSPDETVAIARSLAESAPVPVRVESLAKNSGGPAAPLNAAVRLARTRYVAVLEQDDRMPPNRLGLHAEAVAAFPDCQLSFGRFELIGCPNGAVERLFYDPMRQAKLLGVPEGRRFARLTPAELFPVVLRQHVAISNSNLFFTRQLWRAVGGFDPTARMTSDWRFFLAAARRAPAAYVNEVCLIYHYAPNSLCRAGENAAWLAEMAFIHELMLRHPVAAGNRFWREYWLRRRHLVDAVRRGRVMEAARSAWLLVRTGALLHHLRNRSAQVEWADCPSAEEQLAECGMTEKVPARADHG